MNGVKRIFRKRNIVLALLAVGIYLEPGLRHQAGTGTPDWVDACGRAYVYPSKMMTRDEALEPGMQIIGSTQIGFFHKNVWALPPHNVGGHTTCGLVIEVEFDDNQFREYVLSGGL